MGKRALDNYEYLCTKCARLKWQQQETEEMDDSGKYWVPMCRSKTSKRLEEITDVKDFTRYKKHYLDWKHRLKTGELWACKPSPISEQNLRPGMEPGKKAFRKMIKQRSYPRV